MAKHKRRHHNTKGLRQIKRGNTKRQMERLAQKLGIRYGVNTKPRGQ